MADKKTQQPVAVEEILEAAQRFHPEADIDVIRLAYDYAQDAHQGQKRMTGEPYFVHPANAALLLAKTGMSPDTVAAALLHDVPEETDKTIDDITKDFGADIAFVVEGVTKVGKVKYRGVERYIENLRKMFVAMAVDLRVIVIRFADRIDNLQTLHIHPPDKAKRIALESLEIYAPIANRLGMNEYKDMIEDTAFRYAFPDEYQWVMNVAKQRRTRQEKYLRRVQKQLEQQLQGDQFTDFTITGRVKHLYSLYQKLMRYDGDVNRIHDLVALRVIVNTVSDCYRVLGVIHQLWTPIPGRIKDYIAQPKANGYQSLHTTVTTKDQQVVEFQIRTGEMHRQAEFGVAAHWQYDEKKGGASYRPDKAMDWVQELTEWSKEIAENQKNLERLKVDVLKDRIFVFTPKGDVIDLPMESTPVDFAYAIHTDIGNKCSRAYVNEQQVALDHQLKNGDIVEILMDKNRKGPNPDWLKFVKSSSARNRIRAASNERRKSFIGKILEK